MGDDEILLRVEGLCMHFGKTGKKAVEDVSFDIRRGEVFGLVGESGCGKTTTGRTIIKLYNAASGNVYFKGRRIVAGTEKLVNELRELRKGKPRDHERIARLEEELAGARYDQKHCDESYRREIAAKLKEDYAGKIKNAPQEEKSVLRGELNRKLRETKKDKLITKIQMIYQDPMASLDPRMTVREIIAEGLVIQGIKDEKWIDERVRQVLQTVGLLQEHAGRYPHEFSGGQRQRIGIARAIIMNPELIIADEPISALDVSIRAQVINLLNDLRESMGLTILFIAHDLSIVKYFCQRVAVMYGGTLVELADTRELFETPLHPYTRSLLSAIPLPDPQSEKKRVRIPYEPEKENGEDSRMREVWQGHFVRCSEKELEKYRTWKK